VDDCLVADPKKQVLEAGGEMKDLFDCNNIGELQQEYVGCKIVHDQANWLR
jgi:hypothetical protein